MLVEVKKFGAGGAHIILPKEFLGKTIEIPIIEKLGTFMKREEIEKMIDEKILEAKRGY